MSPSPTVIRAFAPDGYQPHALHTGERDWGETNCYVDLWIEVLHTLGLDPHAMLAFAPGIQHEGDQFTFFKPPLADLEDLYGIQVEELCLWRGLDAHVETQVAQGRLAIIEVDPYYLPDTHGVNYRVAHGKTSLAANAIDRAARRLGYFHNAGYWLLEGDDYDGALRTTAPAGSMTPYVELARLDRLKRLDEPALRRRSRELLATHLGRRVQHDPVERFRAGFAAELEWLRGQPMDAFHQWAFVTVRQLGAACELSSRYLEWLARGGDSGLAASATRLRELSSLAKALQFKVVRALTAKRPLDADAALTAMCTAYQAAIAPLV